MTDVSQRRWGDNDRNFGPFTYARDERGYRPLAFVLKSGGDGDYRQTTMRLSGFGHTLIAIIPGIIKPWRKWVDTSKYEWSKSPDGGYWDVHPREYGFSLSEGFFQVFLGAQTHDSETTQSWSKFLPWTEWRHVRHSYYDLAGAHVADEFQRAKGQLHDRAFMDAQKAVKDGVPKAAFQFADYDGEHLTANTHIEEREWLLGEGWFKWLSLFCKPKIRRSLDIQFSGETGERKGSWKGGTTGHIIEMKRGELHEAAFRRYCAEHKMTFIG